MNTPFGPSFAELTLADLQAFFEDPRQEGLTWEAKGGQITPYDIRDSACGFANGFLDGYLVLGIDSAAHKRQDPCKFTLGGWAPKGGGEPDTWISTCLVQGVEPRPHFEPKSWPIGDARWITVVLVRPVPVPPCITVDGKVFERLSGITSPVTSSEALRGLYARGNAAAATALSVSNRALDDIWEWAQGDSVLVPPLLAVAIAAPALGGDVSSMLFRESTRSLIEGAFRGTFPNLPIGVDQFPDAMLFQGRYPRGIAYAVRVDRFGGVAVLFGEAGLRAGPTLVAGDTERVSRMWGLANTIARGLGAYGPSHVALHDVDHRLPHRWSSVEHGPDASELATVGRQAARLAGAVAWDPEPAAEEPR